MTPSATCVTTHTTGHRRTAIFAAALALATSLTGCGLLKDDDKAADSRPVAHSGPITIGFSPVTLDSPMLRDLSTGLQSYAKTKGAEVMVADPRNDALTQVRQLDAWIESGRVQAIWAIAVDASALRPVFDRAHAKGIAVLATGTPQDYGQTGLSPGRSYSYIDYRAYGREVGKAVGACAEKRLNGRARVLYLRNSAGNVGVADYTAGLREGLTATSPASRIVADADSNSDNAASVEATTSALRDDNINAVAAANDDAVLGTLQAFEKARVDKAKSCLVGSGGSAETLAAVHDGRLYAVSALQYKEDVRQHIDQMLQMIADPRSDGLQLLTPIETITR